MARNDEGEFELILGNRQLLLVFGVLVLVLGVFFTMGYLVGRNNPSQEALTLVNSRRIPIEAGSGPAAASQSSIIVDPTNSGSVKSPAKNAAEMAAAKVPEEKPKLPEVPVVPLASAPKPADKSTADAQPQETKARKEQTNKEEAAKQTPKPKEASMKEVPASDAGAGKPATGIYLQVVSVDKAGAQSMISSLRNKSFPTVLAPGATPELYRVLIGPLEGKEALAKAKIDLEKVGIKGAFVKKY